MPSFAINIITVYMFLLGKNGSNFIFEVIFCTSKLLVRNTLFKLTQSATEKCIHTQFKVS